jgi:hypothetical protein
MHLTILIPSSHPSYLVRVLLCLGKRFHRIMSGVFVLLGMFVSTSGVLAKQASLGEIPYIFVSTLASKEFMNSACRDMVSAVVPHVLVANSGEYTVWISVPNWRICGLRTDYFFKLRYRRLYELEADVTVDAILNGIARKHLMILPPLRQKFLSPPITVKCSPYSVDWYVPSIEGGTSDTKEATLLVRQSTSKLPRLVDKPCKNDFDNLDQVRFSMQAVQYDTYYLPDRTTLIFDRSLPVVLFREPIETVCINRLGLRYKFFPEDTVVTNGGAPIAREISLYSGLNSTIPKDQFSDANLESSKKFDSKFGQCGQ